MALGGGGAGLVLLTLGAAGRGTPRGAACGECGTRRHVRQPGAVDPAPAGPAPAEPAPPAPVSPCPGSVPPRRARQKEAVRAGSRFRRPCDCRAAGGYRTRYTWPVCAPSTARTYAVATRAAGTGSMPTKNGP